MFGRPFAEMFGDSPNAAWISTCERLTDAQCERGLDWLATKGDGYPPSVPKFYQACTSLSTPNQTTVPASKPPQYPDLMRQRDKALYAGDYDEMRRLSDIMSTLWINRINNSSVHADQMSSFVQNLQKAKGETP